MPTQACANIPRTCTNISCGSPENSAQEVSDNNRSSDNILILYFLTVQNLTSKQKYCIGMPSSYNLITVPPTCSLVLMLVFLTSVHSKYTSEPIWQGNRCGGNSGISGSGILAGTSGYGDMVPSLSYTSRPMDFKLCSWFLYSTSQGPKIMEVPTTYWILSCFYSFSCDNNCNRTVGVHWMYYMLH